MSRASLFRGMVWCLLEVAVPGWGCAGYTDRWVDTRVAPRPGALWRPPAGTPVIPVPATPEGGAPSRGAPAARPGPGRPFQLPPGIVLPPGGILSLEQIVDLALRNDSRTRVAWHQARAEAAALRSVRSSYFPTIDVALETRAYRLESGPFASSVAGNGAASSGLNDEAASSGLNDGTASSSMDQRTLKVVGPSADLSWVLLDFGGREARVDEARYLLEVANWTYNTTIRDVILQVEQAYYQYLTAKALLKSAAVSLSEAEENLRAADARRAAGVATIADVLQARTAVSQSRLSLETTRGQLFTLRGSLATALGVPVDIPVDVGELPWDVDLEPLAPSVNTLLATAAVARPELAAARARVEQLRSNAKAIRARWWPSLSLDVSWSRFYYLQAAENPYGDSYSIDLSLSFTLLNGIQNAWDYAAAREQTRAAEEQLADDVTIVDLQVWTSYYNVRTAAEQVKSGRDLLASAQASAKVALGRYQEGVGSILELLAAQSALAQARALEVQARAGFLLSLAQLAHDTGRLTPGAVRAGLPKGVETHHRARTPGPGASGSQPAAAGAQPAAAGAQE